MKAGYYWAVLLMAQLAGHSAPPPVQLLWDKAYGGDWRQLPPHPDVLQVVVPLPDGGLLLAGDSGSPRSASKTAPFYGGWDIWVVRLDADGNQVWDQSYGGTKDDRIKKILALPDGGFLLAGESSSCASGTKTSCASGVGTDWWLVRIDAVGRQLWEQSYWITDYCDRLTAVVALPDGGFLVGGWDTGLVVDDGIHFSLGGDYWLVWVDVTGKELRRQRYGGVYGDQLADLVPTADEGFLLCGNSLSGVGGNKTTPHCGESSHFDVWLVRVDAQGQKLWEQDLAPPSGGSYDSPYLKAVPLADGGFAIGITAASENYHPLGFAASQDLAIRGQLGGDGCASTVGWGQGDYCLVRLDPQGSVLWSRPYGGDSSDWLLQLRGTPDGGFWLGGSSASGATGNKTCGGSGAWLVRVNGQGEVRWDRCLSSGNPWRVESGLSREVFVLGTTAEAAPSGSVPSFFVSPWVMAVGPGGDPIWELALPFEQSDRDALYLFGRTADGGFFAAGHGTPSAATASKYRVVKIGPAPIPAALDRARLLPMRELQGALNQDGFLLSLVGVQNTTYVTEYSTNLRDWRPFATNHVGSVDVKVRDLGATNAPERYYRARKQSP